MSNKQQKKIRQLVRRNENRLVDQCWDIFFETVSKMKKKDRRKIARLIVKGINLRELFKSGITDTRNKPDTTGNKGTENN